MRALVVGAAGQLGWELQRCVPPGVVVDALDADRLNITDAHAVAACVADIRPQIVINAAAYTAVDKAESEREVAFAVNSNGAAHVAEAAKACGARLLHVSTDFVFDGRQSCPYLPSDAAHAEGVYGASKLEGERRVGAVLGNEALILRTAWVYSAHGNNFVKTMLRLMRERDSVNVVADQIGTPTWAHGLARAAWALVLRNDIAGTYHWTDAGVASWYDFAVAIHEEALAIGLLERGVPVRPIRTQDYPTAAKRPAFSVLDKTTTWGMYGDAVVHWRTALRAMLRELKEATV